MSDILDRLNARCWPHEQRDELCMDAWYVITDLRARVAEAVACCTIKDNRNLRLEARLAEAERLILRMSGEGFERAKFYVEKYDLTGERATASASASQPPPALAVTVTPEQFKERNDRAAAAYGRSVMDAVYDCGAIAAQSQPPVAQRVPEGCKCDINPWCPHHGELCPVCDSEAYSKGYCQICGRVADNPAR